MMEISLQNLSNLFITEKKKKNFIGLFCGVTFVIRLANSLGESSWHSFIESSPEIVFQLSRLSAIVPPVTKFSSLDIGLNCYKGVAKVY